MGRTIQKSGLLRQLSAAQPSSVFLSSHHFLFPFYFLNSSPIPPLLSFRSLQFTILLLECFTSLTSCSPPPLGPLTSLISLLPPFPCLPLSSHSHFTSLLLFLRFVPSSLSWVSLLSYILQPSAAFLFTPFCIFYITLLCFLAPPLFPLLVVSLPVSVSGHQPHTWLIDF